MANNLMRFDPFGDLVPFDQLRGVGKFFRNFHLTPSESDIDVEPRIKIDVAEADDAYRVKAEIPGVKKEDIKISVDGNQVSISAEVKREKDEKKAGEIVRSERYFGRQFRSFALAHDIDESKADASYHDGILELSLPKKPGNGSSKQIAVK